MEYSGWAQYKRILTDCLNVGIQRCWNSQISREGKRYKIPSDIATLSFFVKQCLDNEDIEDEGDTDRNNGNGGEVVHEIPLYAINSFVLAEIVKYMECYKWDPSEFFQFFVRYNITDNENWINNLQVDDIIVF